MKNLANCKPSEFLRQTNKIRKAVEKWLKDTGVLKIRMDKPKLERIDPSLSTEEKAKVIAENERRSMEQARANLSRMLDAMLDEYPDETLEILALLCFVEPEDVDSHTVSEYLEALSEILSDQAVIGFFTSLTRWEQNITSDVSQK